MLPLFSPKGRTNSGAFELIARDVTRHYPYETGGLLVGYWISKKKIVVTRAIGAGPRAKRGRTWFIPDTRYQRRELARIYEESGRKETYLGDWHSHPNGPPKPSFQDKRTARQIANYVEARCPRPMMLIIGYDGNVLDLGPYVWTSFGLHRFDFVIADAEGQAKMRLT